MRQLRDPGPGDNEDFEALPGKECEDQVQAGFNPMENCITIASVLCIYGLKMQWKEKYQLVGALPK